MIEFKNVSINGGTTAGIDHLSAMVAGGETMLIYGATAGLRHRLMTAIMGLTPVDKGFLTIDGEQITPDAARFYRRDMAFVPADTLLPYPTLRDLINATRHLQVNRRNKDLAESPLAVWREAGISEDVCDKPWKDIDADERKTALTGVTRWLGKRIILIEEITTTRIADMLRKAAAEGCIAIATADDDRLADIFDTRINLNHTEQ